MRDINYQLMKKEPNERKIAALVKHSSPPWGSVLWIIFLGLLLYVCIDNLFFPDRHK